MPRPPIPTISRPANLTAVQPANPEYAQHVLTRLTDFCQPEGTPWTRQLWDLGSVLSLEELRESATRQLPVTSHDWQRRQLARLIGLDLGMGEQALRQELTQLLNSDALADPSPGHRRLRVLIEHARDGYLDRWADRVAEGTQVHPDRLAHALATHLLDLGYTAQFLTTRWLPGLQAKNAHTEAIIASAAGLARIPLRKFHVLLSLSPTPEHISGYLTSSEVANWLKGEGHSPDAANTQGGFLYAVRAHDPYAAADNARQLLERLLTRSSFAHQAELVIAPKLWVSGHPEPLPALGPTRHAELPSLTHHDRHYDVAGPTNPVDLALALAAPVHRAGATSAAVAGAWSAIESLLCHPGDPAPPGDHDGAALAADRLAAIVACSWPATELTTLAQRHGDPDAPDELSRRRDACETPPEQAQLLLTEITRNGLANLRFHGPARHSDRIAAQRLATCVAEPKRVVGELAAAARIAFRRLHRAHQLVLHGGPTPSAVQAAALRTVVPLLAAGLDGIARACFETGLEPLALAARAELAMALVGGETGLSLANLLREPGSV